MFAHRPSDVNKIVGDHAEPDPLLHSVVALVSATIETVSPLDHTDAPFASGTPFLADAEPAFLLLAFAFDALARSIRNTLTFDPHGFRSGLVSGGIEPGVSR